MNSIKQIYTNSFNRLTSIFTTKKLELIESLKQSDPQYQTTDFKISIEEDMAPGEFYNKYFIVFFAYYLVCLNIYTIIC